MFPVGTHYPLIAVKAEVVVTTVQPLQRRPTFYARVVDAHVLYEDRACVPTEFTVDRLERKRVGGSHHRGLPDGEDIVEHLFLIPGVTREAEKKLTRPAE